MKIKRALNSYNKILKLPFYKGLTILSLILFFFKNLLSEISSSSYLSNKWTIGEWLINYEGGFVRRGLPGQIIYFISSQLNISPIIIVKLISIISIIGFILIITFFVFRLIPLTFILSPFLLNLPEILRKDFFILFLYGLNLLIIYWYLKGKFISKLDLFIFINTVSTIAILSHEKYIFFALPSLFIFLNNLVLKKKNNLLSYNSLIKTLFFLLPSIICLISVLTHRGDLSTSNSINNSWVIIKNLIGDSNTWIKSEIDLMSPIGSLSWDISKAIEVRNSVLYYFYIWPLYYLIGIYCFIIGGGRETLELRIQIIVLQILCMSPLFYVSSDYGRLLFYLLSSSCLIYGFMMKLSINKLFNLNLQNILKINFLKNFYFNSYFSLIYLFIFIPTCCLNLNNILSKRTPFYMIYGYLKVLISKFV